MRGRSSHGGLRLLGLDGESSDEKHRQCERRRAEGGETCAVLFFVRWGGEENLMSVYQFADLDVRGLALGLIDSFPAVSFSFPSPSTWKTVAHPGSDGRLDLSFILSQIKKILMFGINKNIRASRPISYKDDHLFISFRYDEKKIL